MPSSQCSSFVDVVGPWMEGERSPALQAHLQSCASCRSLVSDLETIHSIAQEFPEPEPPPRVWASIRSQIEAEQAPRGWRRWFAAGWPRPVMATATLAVLVVAGFVAGHDVRRHKNIEEWQAEVAKGTTPIQKDDDFNIHQVSALPNRDAMVNASFQKNLQVVDNYIQLCEKSVHEDPQNELARDYLFGAYQQKADLLAEMHERGDDAQ
jgi:hypothetical protein